MRKILLDCDPGIDDALALIYLAALHRAGEIELVGVTTTAGNVSVEQTARNAAWILDGLGVPVAAGLPGSTRVPLVTTPETHGEFGLGYVQAPFVPGALAPDWRALWNQQAELIVTGPLTNAAAYGTQLFDAVTVMGGAINYRGNTTPTAEWNFWVDPHAAAAHFDSGVMTTLCSLGVTEGFLIGPERLEAIMAQGAPYWLPEALRFYFEFHQAQGEGYQAQIHDLVTCMVAIGTVDYDMVETTVRVEADSQLMRGTSAADLRGHWDLAPNCRLVTAIDYTGAHAEFDRALGL